MSNQPLLSPSQISELSERLESAYHLLHLSTITAQNAAKEAVMRRQSVTFARDTILLANAADPKAMGANEPAREAYLRDCTAMERGLSDAAEENHRDAENALRLAALGVEAARAQLRIVEVAASVLKGGDAR